MHLLGHHLPDHKLLKVALTSFYGISHHTSGLLLSRLSIPSQSKVSDLTENQITSLSAFLSSPSTTPRPAPTPLAVPQVQGTREKVQIETEAEGSNRRIADPLDGLKIETDLRRSMQADIAHQRQVGSYRGRRHALGLPVRGQNTRCNAHTAKKLNRVDRRQYSSVSSSLLSYPPSSKILDMLRR